MIINMRIMVQTNENFLLMNCDIPVYMLGQVNLISRLSSRVTKKYGAGWRILFYNFYFPKEKLLMTSGLFFEGQEGMIIYQLS
jgi:hypothetical protein